MGYRPEFKDTENPDLCFYGTKLYGYVNEKELSSYQYLLSIEKVTSDDIWDYAFPHEMVLTAEQFRVFMKLYEKDFDKEAGFEGCLAAYADYKNIEELLKTDSDKHIEWF